LWFFDIIISFQFYTFIGSFSSTLYPSGSSQKAITRVPCFMGPGFRVIFIPCPARSSQAL